jgi:hypothetical protein
MGMDTTVCKKITTVEHKSREILEAIKQGGISLRFWQASEGFSTISLN